MVTHCIRVGTGILWLTGILLALVVHAWAADDVDRFTLSPEQLFNATVVSVSRTSERVMDAPAAISVLTGDDIRRAGATSVQEALRLVPGVQVAQVNANSWAVSVRGFNGALANKLLVRIDGRDVYDPLFSGVYWDIQDVMLDDIDRIEVVRGPGASLWGANAVNGVINIITKKARDTQGVLAAVTAGTKDRTIAEGRYGGSLGENGHYRVFSKYLNRSDLETVAGSSAHDGQQMGHAGFRADWDGTPQGDFTFQGEAYDNRTGDMRLLPTFTSPFSELSLEKIEARGAHMLGRWDKAMGEDSNASVQSYLDYTMRKQDILGDERITFDLDAQYELPAWGRNKIIFGAGYRYSHDTLTASPYVSFTDDGEDTHLFSSFIQNKITLAPKELFLTLGSKFQHNDFTGFEMQPNARLQWHPDDTQMIWGSIARAVRTPSRLEHDLTINQAVLSVFGFPAELRLVPNTDFEAERVTAYEMGYRNQLTPELSVDLAGFYNDYTYLSTLNFLTPQLISPPFLFPITSTNGGRGNTQGIEASVDWRPLDNLQLAASYSLVQIHLIGPPSNVAINSTAAIEQSPSQQANFVSRWDITDRIALDSTLYYVGAVPGFKVPEYWRLDMRLGWQILDGLEFSLVGQNLLQGEHREFSSPTDIGAVEIPRSIYGRFTWRY
ncbi:MAG: TonB-dependent receptor [Alphaproteobacteria bacterium]|nr:TonB-dependent receptor [Alphaproteobacteria bacterium]